MADDIRGHRLSFSPNVFAPQADGIRIARDIVIEGQKTDSAYDIDRSTGVVYCNCRDNSRPYTAGAALQQIAEANGTSIEKLYRDDYGIDPTVVYTPRGNLLVNLIDSGDLSKRPGKIVFVDDEKLNMESMQGAMAAFNAQTESPIPMLCILNLTQ
jgi:hypothetical protein